jgi:hypothetical protein
MAAGWVSAGKTFTVSQHIRDVVLYLPDSLPVGKISYSYPHASDGYPQVSGKARHPSPPPPVITPYRALLSPWMLLPPLRAASVAWPARFRLHAGESHWSCASRALLVARSLYDRVCVASTVGHANAPLASRAPRASQASFPPAPHRESGRQRPQGGIRQVGLLGRMYGTY